MLIPNRKCAAFYEKQNQKLSAERATFVLPGSQIDFYAQPFYFHINKATDLIYKWSFAGKEAVSAASEDANLLTLTIPQTSREGSDILRVKAENPRVLGEQAKAEI